MSGSLSASLNGEVSSSIVPVVLGIRRQLAVVSLLSSSVLARHAVAQGRK